MDRCCSRLQRECAEFRVAGVLDILAKPWITGLGWRYQLIVGVKVWAEWASGRYGFFRGERELDGRGYDGADFGRFGSDANDRLEERDLVSLDSCKWQSWMPAI
ncbi:hypothetical protein Nepgr_009966 [Nepenthes gracilis]|uniref:Uncharacterized protein n=1 Tax=Nepenthes gracilis TaxID=150966 RepID=A0AAD3SC34_NEPGR|nr:hypothetical protein Nepgr_009966 [Nepenthes gracilis]